MTEHDGGQAVESATAQQAEPPPIRAQTIAPEHRHGVHQRSTTLLATVLGAVITALVGGMFLFIVSALDRVSEEVSSLRSEMSEQISSLRSGMSEEVSSLRGEISGETSSIRGEISDLRGEISGETSSIRGEISDLRGEISSLRSEMNARFVETDRKFDQVNQRFDQVNQRFDQVNSVLMDHTDRLARIETTLDINGRPLPSETDDPTGP
ncbi:hypothetical protein [Candidatus Poriferisodalis sp.]|uniref:hypothetical protein n=1 Tax=Candidatus Poriferisodalis sp. TaxID=3101277 RepID=UPI003B529CBB